MEFNQAMALETEGKRLDADVLRGGVEAVLNDSEKGFYAVAENGGGQIVGGLLVTFEWSDWRNAQFWWIQSVYILPEERGKKNIQSALRFRQNKSSEARRRLRAFRLYVEREKRRSAARFTKKLGMKASHYLMYEELL